MPSVNHTIYNVLDGGLTREPASEGAIPMHDTSLYATRPAASTIFEFSRVDVGDRAYCNPRCFTSFK